MLGSSWVDAQLAGSQEGFSPMSEWVRTPSIRALGHAPRTWRFHLNPPTLTDTISYCKVLEFMVSIAGQTTVVLFLAIRSNNGGSHPVTTAIRSQNGRQFSEDVGLMITTPEHSEMNHKHFYLKHHHCKIIYTSPERAITHLHDRKMRKIRKLNKSSHRVRAAVNTAQCQWTKWRIVQGRGVYTNIV
jgi:hypothetical protein